MTHPAVSEYANTIVITQSSTQQLDHLREEKYLERDGRYAGWMKILRLSVCQRETSLYHKCHKTSSRLQVAYLFWTFVTSVEDAV